MKQVRDRLIRATKSAIPASIKAALWLLKMMIPITLLISIASYLGIIGVMSEYASPLFAFIGLDGRAALVFITSIIANIYSSIGVMAGLGLDFRSVTILATMCLIAHNLIIETVIQRKIGSSIAFILTLRIGGAIFAGFVINKIIPADYSGTLFLNIMPENVSTWSELLYNWAVTMGLLSIRILIIVTLLHILQNILREFKIIDLLTIPLKPFIKLLGLTPNVSFLWIIANTLGLAYGGAVITNEIANGDISKEEARYLNTSVSMTHSLLEDTILFMSLGIVIWWLVIPRLIMSVICVWGERGIKKIFYLYKLKTI